MTIREKLSYVKSLEALIAASLFFLVLHLVTGYRNLVAVPVILMAAGLLSKNAAEWLGRMWFAASHAVGFLNNRILLTFVFYGVLTPLAFANRLSHRKLLQLRKNPGIASYFIDRNKKFIQKDFEKLW